MAANSFVEEQIAQIREMERGYQYNASMKVLRTSGSQEMQEQVLSLLKIAYYARYGDYLASICKKIKKDAEEYKTTGHDTLRRYWTDIDRDLKRESPAYSEVMAGKPSHHKCPVSLAVQATTTRVGFNFDQLRRAISLYAERNELVHCSLDVLILEKKYFTLFRTFQDDLCQLPAIIPPTEIQDFALMKSIIQSLIKTCCVIAPGDEDNWEAWQPSEDLNDLHDDLVKTKKSGQKLFNKALPVMIKDLGRSIDKEKRWEEMEGAEKRAGLPLTKRVALSSLEEERQKFKKQKSEHEAMLSIQAQAIDRFAKYREAYGSTESPRWPVPDDSLDDD